MTNTAQPTRRQAAKAATREKILAAARTLFLVDGYDDTTIRDVAAAAGMSTGAVFQTVDDKAQLWREAMGGPAPDAAIALQIALVAAELPGWTWTVGMPLERGLFTAAIRSPDFNPSVTDQGIAVAGKGATPAEALARAREDALPHARAHTGILRAVA